MMMRPPATGPDVESDPASPRSARAERSSVVPQDSDEATRNAQRTTGHNRDIRGGRCKFHAATTGRKKAGPNGTGLEFRNASGVAV